MQEKLQIDFLGVGSRTVSVEDIDWCPNCKAYIKSQFLSGCGFYDKLDHPYVSINYLCKKCYKPFLAIYKANEAPDFSYLTQMIYYGPKKFQPFEFEKKINELSSDFVKIYNQSLQAETEGLDQIAGMGYRKALEFLVKDFVIHKNPENANDIKVKPLASCINDIDDKRIHELAKKSSWLGNDETHYIKKHTDRDIQDLKMFIKATVHFILSELTFEEAQTIEHA